MIRTSTFAILALLSASPLPASYLLGSPGPAVSPVQQKELSREEFVKQLRQAMDIGAENEIVALVRRNQETATTVIIETCEAISRDTDERLESEIAALQTAWKAAYSSDFATHTYEYFALMRVQVRAFRSKTRMDYDRALRGYDEAVAAKNLANLDIACGELESIAGAFAEVGDHYFVSECWWRIGYGYDENVRGNKANFVKAGAAYAKTVAEREEIDLKDRTYTMAKGRMGVTAPVLEEKPITPEATGGFTRTKPGVALGDEVGHDLTFAIVEDIEAILRPGYGLQNLPMVWNSLNFARPGSTSDFSSFPNGPQVLRTGSGAEADADRDGKGDVPVPLTGNIEAVEVTIGEGDAVRKWGFLSTVLTEREVYQGIVIPMQPQEAFMSLPVAPCASMVGAIDGTSIRVIDENMDGVYGSQPAPWGFFGLTEGQLEPVIDSLVVGESKRAVPWSEYVSIGSNWYQLLSDRSGVRVVASPAKLVTGTLKVKSKGVEPLYLVVRGAGTFEYSYFDVMAGGTKGVEVPVGSYSLLFGEVRRGKRTQVQKALILPSERMVPWIVRPGETTEIQLGAPFDLEFKATDEAGIVKVIGSSIAVIGSAKERYERLWNCGVQPEVFLRKVGSKKGGRGEGMKVVLDYETLTAEGFQIAWFPRDLEIEKRSADDQVEVQLIEEKNKLFGEIESSWQPTR